MKRISVLILFFAAILLLVSCEDSAPAKPTAQVSNTAPSGSSTTTSQEISTSATTTTTAPAAGFEKADSSDDGVFNYDFNYEKALSSDEALIAYQDLKNYVKSLDGGDNFSFSFLSLESGCSLSYRADVTYDTCSVIKAPFALYLLEKGVDLTEKVACSNYIGGSGMLKKADIGEMYSVKTYIDYMIKYSDNCAYMTLLDHFGREDFTAYLKKSGNMNTRLVNCSFGWMSANDAIVFLQDIYDARETEYGKYLFDLMENTEFNELITGAGLPYDIAHKFGDDEIRICLHDAAIIESESPYLLAIFSKCNENTEMEAAKSAFQHLTKYIDKLNVSICGGNSIENEVIIAP